MFELPKLNLKDKVSEQEWQLRVDLAACYRLVEHMRWGDLIYTHMSARLPGTEHYLVNAFGLSFDEVTASNLVKVDLQGNILDDTPFEINPAGFTIHSAIHEVREDAHCVIHLHTKETIAVASLECGLTRASLPVDAASLTLKSEKTNAHSDRITSVAFSPDGKTIVSGSWDKTLKVWGERHRNRTPTFARADERFFHL